MFRRVGLILLVLLGLAATLPAAAQTPPPALDKEAIEKIVRDYLLANPELLIEAMQELEKKQGARRQAAADKAIVEQGALIFEDPDSPIGGNPKGDVTIVEFFDYHCGYCKQVQPVLNQVLSEDKQIRVIYKELPILSDNSRFAALAALAAVRQGKYVELHNALMENRGQVTKERLTQLAGPLKIDPKKLLKDMEDDKLAGQIDKNLDLARLLNVTGTPGFLIGKKLVPGAIDYSTLKRLVQEARAG